MHFQWAKSAENRQLQNDAISSVFNSQSTFCTKVVGIFELRTKIKFFFQNRKFIAAKKLKTVFFLKNFEIFWKTPPKFFSPTFDEIFMRSFRCLFYFSFRICNPFEDRAINDCAKVASLTSGRAETIPMQNRTIRIRPRMRIVALYAVSRSLDK